VTVGSGVGPIEAGVGTGGFVSVGAAEPGAEADGVPELGTALIDARARTDFTTDTGFGARGTQSPTDPGAGLLALTGALPKAPAPPGALTAGGVAGGPPSAHPAPTAKGRPSATRPRNTVLGERRTP